MLCRSYAKKNLSDFCSKIYDFLENKRPFKIRRKTIFLPKWVRGGSTHVDKIFIFGNFDPKIFLGLLETYFSSHLKNLESRMSIFDFIQIEISKKTAKKCVFEGGVRLILHLSKV